MLTPSTITLFTFGRAVGQQLLFPYLYQRLRELCRLLQTLGFSLIFSYAHKGTLAVARGLVFFLKIKSTSGASDTIFMKPPSRNSRATGPKIRVPRGVLSSRMITAAFSSNLMYEPSARRAPDLVRTITALTTSPFLTAPPG